MLPSKSSLRECLRQNASAPSRPVTRTVVRVLLGIALGLIPVRLMAQNPIQLENQKPGTSAWKISTAATNHEIEGYASLTSVNRSDSITLYVNTPELSYNISVYRIGWYNGAGGRLVVSSGTLPGRIQPPCPQDSVTGLIECNWTPSYTLNIPTSPTDWTSGIYLAKLTAGVSGKQSYIIFAVRDDGRYSDYFFQSSVTTYQAYNAWGGRSLYGFNSSPAPARKVSFNRPYTDGLGSGDFYFEWEINMLRFLEREGYDVTYCTDIDTHRDASLALQHAGFLVVGHDEYWTWQMRSNVEAARGLGVSLGFFAANIGYWQIRLESSIVTGAPFRTMVGYKQFAPTEDPYYNDSNNRYLSTVRFRDPPVNRPESTLVGVMYDVYDGLRVDVNMILADTSSWVCAGTGLTNGTALPGMVGYEADHVYSTSPPGISVIAHSPVRTSGFSDMATYAAGQATVFATGSMQWSWGLDDTDYHPHGRIIAAVQQMTRNVLARFAGKSVPPPTNLISAVGPPGSINSTYTDYAGMQLRMGTISQTVAQLGFWCQPGDSASHLVKITSNNSGHPDLFAPLPVQCDGVPGFHYVNAPAGISLTANSTYFLLVKGPPFYNRMSVLPTSIATIPRAVSVSQSTYYLESTPNVTYGPLDLKVGTSSTPPVVTPLITSVGAPGSVNSTYTDYAGMQLQMGTASQTLMQLGFWCQSGDMASHLVKITSNNAGNPDLFAPVSVLCDGISGFHYVNAPGGITLAANTVYYLLTKGTPFYNSMSVVPSSVATIPRAVSVSESTYYPESTPNMTYGPLDMKVSAAGSPPPPPPPTTSLVSSVGDLGSVNSTYTDYAGMQLQMVTSQTVTQVGFWCQSSDNTSHLVKMTSDAPGHPDLFAAVPVLCSGSSGFQYTNVPAGISLTANTIYYLLSNGTPFYNRTSIVPTSIATIPRAISVSQSTYYPESTPNVSYGPLDLKVQ